MIAQAAPNVDRQQHLLWPAKDSAYLNFYISQLNALISIVIEAFSILIHKVLLSLKPLQLVSISVTATKKRTAVTFRCV